MNHVSVFIVCFIIYDLFTNAKSGNSSINVPGRLTIDNIADTIILTLGGKTNSNRINELKEKLKNISSYAVDKEKISMLLKNVTAETELNETSFFKSLDEDEKFKFLTEDEPKNLFSKMKERMNREDIFSIINARGDSKKLIKAARKVIDFDYFGDDDDVLDSIVDKLIGAKVSDTHKFDANKMKSIYWDPQGELEDLREHHNHNARRIFRGERTTVRYYPFMVSVHVMGRFWCGGSVYYSDLILTSAACLQLMHNNRFFRENPRVLEVRVGSNHSRVGGEMVDALEVYFHPGYSPRTLRNNIAIIRLRRQLSFSYHRVPKMITISSNAHALPATAEVLLLGWGVTKTSQKMSYEPVYLQRKFLPVYPNSFCKEVYGDKFITDTMFCAGTFTTGEGACDHDAGGPAILAGKLVGIISFGPAVCGYPNAPTVFTLVGAFSDWIETVNETMPPYYRGRVRTTTSTVKPLLEYLLHKYSPMDLAPMIKVIEEEPTTATTTTTEETTTTTPPPETTNEPSQALRMKYASGRYSDEDSWDD